MRLTMLALLVVVLLSGCARGPYRWEGYDRRLESYLLQPEKLDAYTMALDRVIVKAETSGTRVPPGIYAERARVFYLKQDYGRAAAYFDREKAAYPESAQLMDRWASDAEKLSEARP